PFFAGRLNIPRYEIFNLQAITDVNLAMLSYAPTNYLCDTKLIQGETMRAFLSCTVILLLTSAFATHSAFGQTSSPEAVCSALAKLQVPGALLSDVRPQWFPADSPPPAPLSVKLPAYCRLDATLDARTGADGRPYGIGFAIALPANRNGRLLFQGGGGLNGSVAPPLGRTGAGDPALA